MIDIDNVSKIYTLGESEVRARDGRKSLICSGNDTIFYDKSNVNNNIEAQKAAYRLLWPDVLAI